MSKKWLMIIGVLILLMGIAGMIPSITIATEPMWHAVVKVIVGIVAIYISSTDK